MFYMYARGHFLKWKKVHSPLSTVPTFARVHTYLHVRQDMVGKMAACLWLRSNELVFCIQSKQVFQNCMWRLGGCTIWFINSFSGVCILTSWQDKVFLTHFFLLALCLLWNWMIVLYNLVAKNIVWNCWFSLFSVMNVLCRNFMRFK